MPVKNLEFVKVPGEVKPNDTSVGWFNLILLWVKTNMANDILNFFKGEAMNSKLWYTSKTLWTNILTLLWTFVGPMIGVPTLDPETMVGLLAVVNLIIRMITKQPVSIK